MKNGNLQISTTNQPMQQPLNETMQDIPLPVIEDFRSEDFEFEDCDK